jgi:hypothetical protein
MKLFTLKNTVIGSILGSFLLFGAIGSANAQNYNDEYRQWQEAQRRAQQEYRNYKGLAVGMTTTIGSELSSGAAGVHGVPACSTLGL